MTLAATQPATDAFWSNLDPEQRAAAEAPDGPLLIIAPAGSGKTTTLVARLGVFLSRGVAPEHICVLSFNREAAAELASRIAVRLGSVAATAHGFEVRTIHALARQILLDAGETVELVADRLPVLRAARRRLTARGPTHELPEASELDTLLSAWKVERRAPPPATVAVLEEYAALLAARGAIDFDDLVARAIHLLESDPRLRDRWQQRFSHLCIDEFQDVDAAQLRLIHLLAEPQRNLTAVGDDDQTIYAWRLADVRRILDFGRAYPEARRVQLATNYRCPAHVVEASSRLVAVNRERYTKEIRAGPVAAAGTTVSALGTDDPRWADEVARLAAASGRAGRTWCCLARTRNELEPVLLALLRAGVPHRSSVPAAVEATTVERLVDRLRADRPTGHPFVALRRLRATFGWSRSDPAADVLADEDHAALDALLGWASAFPTVDRFVDAHDAARRRLVALREPAAPVELTTVHGAKGREWQTVVVLGWEEERFPNRRALLQAAEPTRALEEERRLAYVAITRATERLILAFDPAKPSRFLAEMGYSPTSGATTVR